MEDSKEIRHLTAFAHFVYEKSDGKYLINDFQEVGRLLTDPVIHTQNG